MKIAIKSIPARFGRFPARENFSFLSAYCRCITFIFDVDLWTFSGSLGSAITSTCFIFIFQICVICSDERIAI